MRPKFRKFGIGITLFVAAMCWGWAYLAAREGYWVTVLIALSTSAAWFLSIRVALVSTRSSPQAEFGVDGTMLKPDVRIDRAVRRLTGTGAVVSWAGLATSVRYGNLYIPLFSELPESFVIIPVVCLGAALGLTWWWWSYRRQGGISFVWLTPEGLRFPTLFGTYEGKWDDIVEIRTVSPDNVGRFWPPLVLMLKNDSYCALESPGIYTPRGTALVELVRYYWQHPEQRQDFTTGRAVERLRELHEINLDID